MWNFFVAGFKPRVSTYLALVAELSIPAHLLGTGESIHWDDLVCPMEVLGSRLRLDQSVVGFSWFVCFVLLLWRCHSWLLLAPTLLSLRSLRRGCGAAWCPCTQDLPLPQHCNFSLSVHPFTSLTCGGGRDYTSAWCKPLTQRTLQVLEMENIDLKPQEWRGRRDWCLHKFSLS